MIDRLIELIDDISPFRIAIPYVNDIDIVYSYIENYNRAGSSHCASVFLQKYQATLSAMGKISGGVRLVYNNNIYKEKTDEDIIDDLYFIIWGILCEAHVVVGISRSIKDFVIRDIYN